LAAEAGSLGYGGVSLVARAAGVTADTRESLEEQAHRKGVRPIRSVHDLARDGVWESDQELDAFLDHVRASRQAETS
jgi:hypothetical protein